MNGAQPLIPPSAVKPVAPAPAHPRAGSRTQLPETGTDDVAPAGSRGFGRPATGKPGLQNEAVWMTSPTMMLWLRLNRWIDERSPQDDRSDEQPSALQSLMRHSFAVFCLQKTK